MWYALAAAWPMSAQVSNLAKLAKLVVAAHHTLAASWQQMAQRAHCSQPA
jgi:hypothetical protein